MYLYEIPTNLIYKLFFKCWNQPKVEIPFILSIRTSKKNINIKIITKSELEVYLKKKRKNFSRNYFS